MLLSVVKIGLFCRSVISMQMECGSLTRSSSEVELRWGVVTGAERWTTAMSVGKRRLRHSASSRWKEARDLVGWTRTSLHRASHCRDREQTARSNLSRTRENRTVAGMISRLTLTDLSWTIIGIKVGERNLMGAARPLMGA